eukprot:1179601-Prorocentrum_minimum.AAC.2
MGPSEGGPLGGSGGRSNCTVGETVRQEGGRMPYILHGLLYVHTEFSSTSRRARPSDTTDTRDWRGRPSSPKRISFWR